MPDIILPGMQKMPTAPGPCECNIKLDFATQIYHIGGNIHIQGLPERFTQDQAEFVAHVVNHAVQKLIVEQVEHKGIVPAFDIPKPWEK